MKPRKLRRVRQCEAREPWGLSRASEVCARVTRDHVTWYARCFWCSAAGRWRGVRTRESVRMRENFEWPVGSGEWRVAGCPQRSTRRNCSALWLGAGGAQEEVARAPQAGGIERRHSVGTDVVPRPAAEKELPVDRHSCAVHVRERPRPTCQTSISPPRTRFTVSISTLMNPAAR